MKKEEAFKDLQELLPQGAYIFPITTSHKEYDILKFYALFHHNDTLNIFPITAQMGVLLQQPLDYEGSHRCILLNPGETKYSLIDNLELLLHRKKDVYSILIPLRNIILEDELLSQPVMENAKQYLWYWTSPHKTKILTQRGKDRQFKIYATTHTPRNNPHRIALMNITILVASILNKPYNKETQEVSLIDMSGDYTQQLVEHLGSFVWSDPNAFIQYTI